MLLGCSLCLLFLLSCLSEVVEGKTLHLDSCSVSVHTHELRKYYSTIRSNAVSLILIVTAFKWRESCRNLREILMYLCGLCITDIRRH